MFDYETMKLIWWLLIGVLLIGFAIMDGHDMGVGALLPFVGRSDVERRIAINSIGPHWDGNQVWFITAGGAIFAAWPMVYATAFSGFYWAMLAVLWALFFRPVGFDYRSKIENSTWRSAWDWGLFAGGAVPALVFGVAFGNLLQGVPFHFDDTLRSTYTGTFWQLLNPFGLLAGVVSFSLLTFHGANYLMLRTDDHVYRRSRVASVIFGILLIVAFSIAGLWIAGGIHGYSVTAGDIPSAMPDVLNKTVSVAPGAWLNNYHLYPATMVVPVLAYVGAVLGVLFALAHRPALAFVSSALAIVGVIGTAGVSMFPFVMPSSSNPNSSLTAWDSTSSHLTLGLMFWAAVIFMPLILLYTAWAYRVMRGKITAERIESDKRTVY